MLTVERRDAWSAPVEDRPGGMKEKIEALAVAGADLDFLIARRLHDGSNKGLVFLTPIEGPRQQMAAERLGFKRTESLHSLRVQGADEPGIAYRVLAALADQQINLRGVSASRQGREFVMFIAFDTCREMERAEARLKMPI